MTIKHITTKNTHKNAQYKTQHPNSDKSKLGLLKKKDNNSQT